MTNYDVVESATITEQPTGKLWKALLIKAGWGTKGYYTEEALKRDGPTVFAAGTPVFLDHQTPEERDTKPFGSVTNLAGELVTDAVWDAEEGGLVADVEIFEHEQARVRSIAKRVGLSIRARTIAEHGTVEGRSGRIVTGLVGAKSVDLVVRAGAGGQLLDVLESDDEQEMEEQQMEKEVLEAINKLSESQNEKFAAIEKKFAEIEESMTAATVEVGTAEVAEVETVDVAALVAEEFAKLAREAADAAAEVEANESAEGEEETTDEVEESASEEINLPKFWVAKEGK